MGTYSSLLHQKKKPEVELPASAEIQPTEVFQSSDSKRANVHTGTQATMPANNSALMRTDLHASLRAFLNKRNSSSTTFRYPPELLDILDRVFYQAKLEHHAKFSKNDVAVLALAYVLWDLEQKQNESLIHQFLIEQ